AEDHRNGYEVGYQFGNKTYFVRIHTEQQDQKIHLFVTVALKNTPENNYKYTKTEDDRIETTAKNEKWYKIILGGDIIQQTPIEFETPDKTPYKKEAVVFILFCIAATYVTIKAKNCYFPKPPKPASNITRRHY
ncbi:MAG: hypothetical protein HRU43_05515, partial [Simkaniaceae bacterium]|nr:hypothetical protein [Simkaniaceae bacterium]